MLPGRRPCHVHQRIRPRHRSFGLSMPMSREARRIMRESGGLMPRLLNVGGHTHAIGLPPIYHGWEQQLLDIDPSGKPDIVCDARNLRSLPSRQFDAIYCSHNLEHYYEHELDTVLKGFLHLLKPDGFAQLRVPDLMAVIARMGRQGVDLDGVLYHTAAGLPIRPLDVIYGWQRQIAQSGVDYFAHKIGFSQATLAKALHASGFAYGVVGREEAALELNAFAFVQHPSAELLQRLGLPRG